MATEWDIAQCDGTAVEQLSALICDWRSLVASLGGPPQTGAVEGGCFSAQWYVIPDRDHGVQLRIHFSAVGRTDRDRWSAWVRCDRPERVDRTLGGLAKRFQRAFRPSKVQEWEGDAGKHAPKFVTTAHWWVGPLQRQWSEDITAQIWLFLLQAGLVTDATRGPASFWCWRYLERRFSRFKVTDEESERLLEALLKQFWRAPSSRAWPAYVRQCIYYLPDRVERRRCWRRPRNIAASSCDDFTVSEAATALQIPESTLYDMLRRREIARVASTPERNKRKPLTLISAADVERLRIQRRVKPKALIERRQRVTGSTYEAARKWVWRQLRRGRTTADIATQLANLRDGTYARRHVSSTSNSSL